MENIPLHMFSPQWLDTQYLHTLLDKNAKKICISNFSQFNKICVRSIKKSWKHNFCLMTWRKVHTVYAQKSAVKRP